MERTAKTIKPNYQKAQEVAYSILKASHNNIFPVSPNDIINALPNLRTVSYSHFAKTHGISIKEACDLLGSNDGVTWNKIRLDQNIIFYNDKVASKNRRRFTLAHELGHYLLGHTRDANFQVACEHIDDSNNENYDVYEKEANYFAKRLLVPLPIVYKLLDLLPSHSISSQDISSVFEVSDSTASYVIENMSKLKWNAVDRQMCGQFQLGIRLAENAIQSMHQQNICIGNGFDLLL